MNAEKQNKIAEFCSISDADPERAEFFLQAAGWDTELAISTFFENDGEVPYQGNMPNVEETRASSMSLGAQGSSTSDRTSSNQQHTNPRRIQTFSNWSGSSQPQEDDENDDGDEEEGQAYYAGGSDQSGQQILGPPRKGAQDSKNVVKSLFKAAKQHGAEVVSGSDRPTKSQRTHFAGTGYRLGESESEVNQPIPGAAVQKKEPVPVILRLWRTGFTINDEPLRPFHDTQNKQFLDSIRKGEIPQELIRMAQGGEVALDMEDHSSEDYVPPKQPKVKAFSGIGQTLGSESNAQPSTSSAVPQSSASAVSVDPSLPVTSVQIRLANGSRLVAKFNHSHTVGDIRSHIVASHPEYAGVAFSLITTLPSRQLTDDSVTLKDADLLNAAVMQKI